VDSHPAPPSYRPFGHARRSRISIWWWELTYRIGPNLWVVPLAMAAGSVVLFVITRRLDRVIAPDDMSGIGLIPEFLIARNPADASFVLSALLSALATALALVFSTTVLTFSLASSQLGPRLIRRFVRDPVTQVTLGLFLSGVLLCSLTLASVTNGAGPVGVPEVSYAVSFVVATTCFVMLVVFVHRIATSIQSPRVVASVSWDLERSLIERRSEQAELDRFEDPAAVAEVAERVRQAGGTVVAPSTGYVQGIDRLRLVDVAEREDLVIVFDRRPGHFVVAGRPLLHVEPAERTTEVAAILHESVEIGDSRTRRQDIEFALYQVVEIGLRALSPAINDTFTGLTCVDWLTAALTTLGAEPPQTGGLAGRDGRLRVFEPPLHFERLVKASYDLIRQAGSANPAVVIRLLDGLAVLAATVDRDHLDTIAAQADIVQTSGLSRGPVAGDAADIAERHARVVAELEARRAERR
jgi:uncharacterized membrane protein